MRFEQGWKEVVPSFSCSAHSKEIFLLQAVCLLQA